MTSQKSLTTDRELGNSVPIYIATTTKSTAASPSTNMVNQACPTNEHSNVNPTFSLEFSSDCNTLKFYF